MATNEVLVAEAPSFLLDGIDLKALHSALKRTSKAAIDVLIACLESQEEKTRLQAAKMLLDFQVTVAKELSADQMGRLIAEIKLARNPQGKIGSGEDATMPRIDFDNIKDV